jgi:hypothetical protein
MSAKTGLSIETLRLIQSKQNAVQQAKDSLTKTIEGEDHSKRLQELIKLAEQIR